MRSRWWWILVGIATLFLNDCKKESSGNPGTLQLSSIKAGGHSLDLQGSNEGIPVNSTFEIEFNAKLDSNSAKGGISLNNSDGNPELSDMKFNTDLKSLVILPKSQLDHSSNYSIKISGSVKGLAGETFPGFQVNFATEPGIFHVENITLNGLDFLNPPFLRDISYEDIIIKVSFSDSLNPSDYKSYFRLSDNTPFSIALSEDQQQVTVTNTSRLGDYKKYSFMISPGLIADNGNTFTGFTNSFYTVLDSSYKFPVLTDEELLDLLQEHTFRYFYDFAHPVAGLARERNTSGDIVTTGGSGFGIMALIVGVERGFITRQEGLDRMDKILTFLETCDRFHGAWPHWLYGSTGKVHPFSTEDDGADLVETGLMVQGLITIRQYLNPGIQQESDLIDRINALVDAVEWDWFTQGQNVLYWHWSPDYGFAINMRIEGYNETLIVYVLAASSTTHGIDAEVYHQGYARNGNIVNGQSYYGYYLPLGGAYGGPLFFTHYSHLGLDPRNLQDEYANYWEQGVNMSLINWAYCKDNPHHYLGYSDVSWGLTACDNPWGYSAHSPTNDLGTVAPTAAVSALPYTPEQSMAAIRFFYYILGDRLWGDYGFYDAFDVTEGWWASSYLAIDEGPIVCMIENYRSGLLWDLFMSAPEIQQGLDKLGFTY